MIYAPLAALIYFVAERTPIPQRGLRALGWLLAGVILARVFINLLFAGGGIRSGYSLGDIVTHHLLAFKYDMYSGADLFSMATLCFDFIVVGLLVACVRKIRPHPAAPSPHE